MENNKHDFLEFAFSKSVVKDYPMLIKLMEKMIIALKPYKRYKSVWLVYQSLCDGHRMMKMHLNHYNEIYKNKGKLSE